MAIVSAMLHHSWHHWVLLPLVFVQAVTTQTNPAQACKSKLDDRISLMQLTSSFNKRSTQPGNPNGLNAPTNVPNTLDTIGDSATKPMNITVVIGGVTEAPPVATPTAALTPAGAAVPPTANATAVQQDSNITVILNSSGTPTVLPANAAITPAPGAPLPTTEPDYYGSLNAAAASMPTGLPTGTTPQPAQELGDNAKVVQNGIQKVVEAAAAQGVAAGFYNGVKIGVQQLGLQPAENNASVLGTPDGAAGGNHTENNITVIVQPKKVVGAVAAAATTAAPASTTKAR